MRATRLQQEASPVGSHLSGLRADKACGSWLGSSLSHSSRLWIRRWPVPSRRPVDLGELPLPLSGPTGAGGQYNDRAHAPQARGMCGGCRALCRGQSCSLSSRLTCCAFVNSSVFAAEVLAMGGRSLLMCYMGRNCEGLEYFSACRATRCAQTAEQS